MLNISKTCKYALRSLVFLGKISGKEFIKIDTVAKENGVPVNYLRKILQRLSTHGIVDSINGPNGGVRLSANGGRVSLAEIVDLLDGRKALNECALFGLSKCPLLKSCPISGLCGNLGKNVWRKLEGTSLSSLSRG